MPGGTVRSTEPAHPMEKELAEPRAALTFCACRITSSPNGLVSWCSMGESPSPLGPRSDAFATWIGTETP
jgi:hypothetical protein